MVFTRNATKDASRDSVLTKEPVAERLDVVEEQRDPAKELEELEQLVGEANAAKLRNVGGIPSRLGTGVVVKGVTRLRDEHQIDIEGKDLVKFMGSSVAARLDDDAFYESLTILGRCVPAAAIARLMCNHIASRFTPDYATHLVDIVTHLDSHGLGGLGKLHRLLYMSPTVSYVPQLRKDILEIDQPDELIAFLERFPSSGGSTYAQLKRTLSELYGPTQTPSAAK